MYSKKKVRLFIFQPYPKFGGDDRSIIKLINGLNFDDITLISLSKCYYSAPVCVPPYVVSYAHLQDPI